MPQDLKKLSEPLSINDIDFRVQSINKGGYATILAYKDARVDMDRLDSSVGPENWQRKHEIVGNNLHCSIGIYVESTNQWVWKSDVGTQSNTEKEKGEASDAFKRAGFNWGIGRELYEYPRIVVQLKEDEFQVEGQRVKQTFKLKLHEWRWFSEFDGSKLRMLLAKDQLGHVRFEWRDIESVKEDAEMLLKMMADNEDLSAIGEAYHELDKWKHHLLWTAASKGGFFNTEQKKLLRQAETEYLTPEEAAA